MNKVVEKKHVAGNADLDYVAFKSNMHVFDLYKNHNYVLPAEFLTNFKFSTDELESLQFLSNRLHALCETARENKVRVKFDAEQTYFQRTIDSIVEQL